MSTATSATRIFDDPPSVTRADRPMAFRPDIEGLRAIAILLVVACHIGLPGLAGGFIGVDVFFVISGYLITRLLMTEWSASGRVDFVAFYTRRIRRLVPALLAMLVATAVAAAIVLAPLEQTDQASAITSAALWLSNVHFALVDLDYFGSDSSSNVVLHTWSLGVEEQFYLVWPAWLLAIIGALRWQSRPANDRDLARGLMVTLVLAIIVAMMMTAVSPRLGFYLAPARAWQFTCGALVFALLEAKPSNSRVRKIAAYCGIAGGALLAAAAMVVDARTPYPGPWTIAPTAGAALLIAAGSLDAENAVGRVLGLRPLQAIGRVSYGWYLWHWPVLVLGGVLVIAPTLKARIALALLSMAIAVISYYGLERPIRRRQTVRRRNIRTITAAALSLAVVACASTLWQRALPSWQDSPSQLAIKAAKHDKPTLARCDDWIRSDRIVPCGFGSRTPRHVVLLLGDSVGTQWFPAIRQVFNREGWQLVVLTKSACPIADIEFIYPKIGRRFDECTRWRRASLDYAITQLQPDIVVFGSSAAYAFDRRDWRNGTWKVLDRIQPVISHVYVLRSTPLLNFDGAACLARRHWQPAWLASRNGCSAQASTRSASDGVLDAISGHAGAGLIDLNGFVCPNGRCAAERNGQIIYSDQQHLTATFARSLAPQLARAIAPAIEALEDHDTAASPR